MWGGTGADTLYGEGDGDSIGGDAGDDKLYGGMGNDTLWGGAGNDVFNGGNKAEKVQDGAGSDTYKLGGGNDTSYPDCSALSLETDEPIVAFNIDAHFDVRADAIRNSGTPYRQLLEEGHVAPGSFYEIGYQPFANSATYVRYLADKGVTAISRDEVGERGIGAVLRDILGQSRADAIFWGLDMDVVTAADAPGVSAINPTGLSGREFCRVAQIAGNEPRTRLFEISEVNPAFDIDGRTCRLAAAALWTFLSAYAGET